MFDKRGRETSGIVKNLALISQLGITMVVPFVAGIIIGAKIDKHLGTAPIFLIICLLLFGAAAFVNFYKIAMGAVRSNTSDYLRRSDKDDKSSSPKANKDDLD